MHKLPIGLACLLLTAGLLAPVAAGDNLTAQCLLGEREDQVPVGDGPFVGDAAAGTLVPVTTGCWNGQLEDAQDGDDLLVVPPDGMFRIQFAVLDGCDEIAYVLSPAGSSGELSLCEEDDPHTLGFLCRCPLVLTFHDAGEEGAVYWFAIE